MEIIVLVNNMLCKDGKGFLMLSTNDFEIYKNKQLEPFGVMVNRSEEMEKQNFKNKVTGAVINTESYNKLPMNLKNGFHLTAEEPTHKVELENGKPVIEPIILEKETKKVNTADEKNAAPGEKLTKEQAEQSTVNEPPAGKNKKAKGEKS